MAIYASREEREEAGQRGVLDQERWGWRQGTGGGRPRRKGFGTPSSVSTPSLIDRTPINRTQVHSTRGKVWLTVPLSLPTLLFQLPWGQSQKEVPQAVPSSESEQPLSKTRPLRQSFPSRGFLRAVSSGSFTLEGHSPFQPTVLCPQDGAEPTQRHALVFQGAGNPVPEFILDTGR